MNNCSDIQKIIKEIGEGKEVDALKSFDDFLLTIPDNCSYTNWTEQWVNQVYSFGMVFSLKNPEKFLNKLSDFLVANHKKNEVLDFIYSEIAWNYFSGDKTYIRNQLKDFKNKYPLNPEFYHSYSHVLDGDGNYKESLSVLQQAIKIDPCERFINTYINRVRGTFNLCVSKNNIKEAEAILISAIKTFDSLPNRTRYTTYTNILPQLEDRLKDHKVIEEKILKIDDIVVKRTEAVKNRFISMLGVFSAIISFILVTANIAIANLKIKEIMLLMLAMADILIIFVISIDYVFYIRKTRKTFFEFLEDKQFWAIIALFLILYVLFKAV